MKKLGLTQCTLSLCACAAGVALLAGCGGSRQGAQIVPASSFARKTAPRQAPAQSRRYGQVAETIYHSFVARGDGYLPEAGLLDVDGTLYGTTASGGNVFGGTVFKIRSFTESVVYSFKGSPDGDIPQSRLIDVNGVLRGTTEVGGTYHKGTVFELTPSGEESVLHSFGEKSDGAEPFAGLTKNLGKLYGTTRAGGDVDYGTVYEINESGAEKVIHSFGKGSDGAGPVDLTNSNGVLYGATQDGPILGSSLGNGTVFQITPSGDETVLYRFAGAPDGAHPSAKLLAVGDVLYGTTREGGKSSRGILFKITTSGKETILHDFAGDPDGADPIGALIDVNGTLYGTTCEGGAYDHGTFYSITRSGTETVLYNFKGDLDFSNPDGDCPNGDLIEKGGSFYGTTSEGGSYNGGTVFSISL